MPTTNLTFNNDINVSVQYNPNATVSDTKGADIIYYSPVSTVGIHNTASAIVELGPVTNISGNTITVDYDSNTALPSVNDFIMFAKNRNVNMSSLLGYFAKFRIKNNSKEKSEIYSISVEVAESSK